MIDFFIAGVFGDPIADSLSQFGIAGLCLFMMFKLIMAKSNERADKALEVANSGIEVSKTLIRSLEAIEVRLGNIEASERSSEKTQALMELVIQQQADQMTTVLTLVQRQTTLMESAQLDQAKIGKGVEAVLSIMGANPDVMALLNKPA